MKAINTQQYNVGGTAIALADFSFGASDLIRMENATIYTKGDILITYDGINPPVASPEFGIYLASGTIFSLTGHDNLDDLEMISASAGNSLVTVVLEYGG